MSRCLLFVAAIASLQAACRAAPDLKPGGQALALRARLIQSDFKGLEGELLKRQEAFERAPEAEDASWSAFEAFAADDLATEALLDAWVKASGGGYPALGARAAYHEGTGWRRRGTGVRDETSQGQFDAMASSFAKAKQDCNAALARNPRLAYCHTLLIRIAATEREGSGIEELLARGREAAPTSFMVPLAYLQSLTPRWGGSYERMAQFAQDSAADASRNPRLRNLSAYVPADRAWVAQLRDDPSAAVALYTEALVIAEEAAIYAGRAGAQYELKRYDLAALDLKRAFELGPQGWHHSNTSLVDALTLNAVALHRAKDQAGAVRHLKRALDLDPRDDYAQEMWTYINRGPAQAGRKKR